MSKLGVALASVAGFGLLNPLIASASEWRAALAGMAVPEPPLATLSLVALTLGWIALLRRKPR
jgi:hypothetical protein